MKREFIENMLRAKGYEMKAIYSLLPDSVRNEIRADPKELFRMIVKCGMELMNEEGSEEEETGKKVRKVTID